MSALATVAVLLQTILGQGALQEITVSGRAVVFVAPADAERDSLVRADGLEMARLLDDFDYYAGRASTFLRQRRIRVESTTSPSVVVRLGDGRQRRLERRLLDDVFCVVLTDSLQEPRLITGVLSDEELIAEFKDFFRLK